jgi:hypothetical protein
VNVNFDDQALHILGFHTGHRGWVQSPLAWRAEYVAPRVRWVVP